MKKGKSKTEAPASAAGAATGKAVGVEVLVNVLLDRSGSMEVCRGTTIDGYNEYLKGLRADTATAYHVSLTQFDAPMAVPELTVSYIDKPLAEVPALTPKDYEPGGTTPLYDAIGEVLRQVADKANGRPVLNVILTDGLENASREFTRESIKALIAEKEKAGHTFVFLGANIDSYAVGAAMGIAVGNIANYAAGNEVTAFASVARSCGLYSQARRATGTLCQVSGESFLDDRQRSDLMGKPGKITSTSSGGTAQPFRQPRRWTVK